MQKSIRFILPLFLFLFSIIVAENSTSKSLVYHIVPHALDESEDMSYARFLQKTFDKAKEENPELIIVEINTPGGELSATFKIKDILLEATMPTVCFINTHALSAGSLIALSCDKIAMAKGAVIGAATPVFATSEGMEKAPEKVVSATRAAWRSAAEANGKDPNIAEAFVDESIVLTKRKHGIDKPKDKLLTLTTEEALNISMIDYQANSITEIIEKEKVKNFAIAKQQPDFFDKFLSFFTNPTVAGLLLGLGMLALFFEAKMPGWGISGALGITLISIYFISLILLGATGWGAPALFAFGVLLLLLEFFVIPGFGFAGIIGFLSLIGAIFWSYQFSGVEDALWVVSMALLGILSGIFMLYKSLPYLMKRNKHIFLSEVLASDSQEINKKFQSFLNQQGVTLTSLRPSGMIELGNQKVDAISQGEYIEKNEKVQVVQIEGNKVVVKQI